VASTPYSPTPDVEVDLDQEALLAVAPNARQRAYFAPNDLGGYLDALNAVGDDASAANPDLHITALSTSWGRCEEDFAPGPTTYTAFEDALDYVVASGVTIFAASGDDGAADACTNAQGQPLSTASVDFPASSPAVIAVGGTSLPNPADPAGQTGWSGSGGGPSQLFARPFWQAGLGIPGNSRLVPDISSDADPATGFAVYATDFPGGPGTKSVGGTSLAAPTQAALLTDELESHGYSWGLGDIHPALYAAAKSSAFVDITSGGSNGAFSPGPGYDLVTGIGTPNWDSLVTSLAGSPHVSVASHWQDHSLVPVSVHLFGTAEQITGWKTGVDAAPACSDTGLSATAPTAIQTVGGDGDHVLSVMAMDKSGVCHYGVADVFVDTRAPNVSTSFGLAAPTAPALAASWAATDPAPSSGLAYYRVVLAHSGGVDVLLARTATTSLRFPGVLPGRTYTLTVVAVDRAGNVSAPVTRAVTVPIDDPALARSPGWHEIASPGDYGGSAAWSTVPHAWMQYRGGGRVFLALVTRTPDSGLVEVLVDGHLQGIVDLYSPVVVNRSPLLLAAFPQVGVHHVVIEALDRSDGVSAGARVWVDALIPEA
ncbi:MAG: S53 family peptidase, partial [Mycobacteriales bacterium]